MVIEVLIVTIFLLLMVLIVLLIWNLKRKKRQPRNICLSCGKIIYPYRHGYTRCKSCFFDGKRPKGRNSLSNFFRSIFNFIGGIISFIFSAIFSILSFLFVIGIIVLIIYFFTGGSISNIPNSLGNSHGLTEGVKNVAQGIIDPKSQIDINELEKEIHRLINIERTNNGLNPLVWDNQIYSIARAHSEDMVERDFFAHENPDGEDPTDRAERQGYICRKDYGSYYTLGLAENIAMDPIQSNVVGCGSTLTLSTLANCIVQGWMNSPGHRKNILTATYTETGIGVAYSEDDEALITQDFC